MIIVIALATSRGSGTAYFHIINKFSASRRANFVNNQFRGLRYAANQGEVVIDDRRGEIFMP
jgi:hypothetical protein